MFYFEHAIIDCYYLMSSVADMTLNNTEWSAGKAISGHGLIGGHDQGERC